VPVTGGDLLRDVHRPVAVYLNHDDRDVATLDHRLELVGVATPDAPPMKFDRVTQRARATRDLGLVALETSDDGDLHCVHYNRHPDTSKALQ